MIRVVLGFGSNVQREYHLRSGIEALVPYLQNLALSPVYESDAFGFVGAPFFNFVLCAHTHLSLPELVAIIKNIEADHGREVGAEKYSSRTLDIDVLTYHELVGEFAGIQLPRAEILQQAYVLKPLADLLPAARHPVLQQTYAELWKQFAGDKAGVRAVDFKIDFPQQSRFVG